MDAGDQQLTFFLKWFLSPAIIPLAGAMLVLVFATITFPRLKWVWLTILLYVTTMGSSVSEPWFDNTLASPLEELRNYGRPICSAMLLLLLIPAFMSGRGWRSRLLLSGAVAYFSLEMVMSARSLAGGIMSRGLLGTFVFITTLIAIGYGASRWMQRREDAYAVLRCITVAAMVLMVVTIYQLAVNRNAIMLNGRLYAVTNNPNTLGYISGLSLPAMCVLLLRRKESTLFTAALFVALGINALFLLWSASRAGLLVSTIGVSFVCRRYINRSLLLLLLILPAMVLAAQLWVTVDWARLVSTADTRSRPWLSMTRQFIQHPLFGGMGDVLTIEENLYLAVAANAGIIGLIPLTLAMILVGRKTWALRRLRPWLGEDQILGDYVQGTVLALAVGSLFDAHLLGTFVFSVICFYLILGIIAFLMDLAEANAAAQQQQWTYASQEGGGQEDLTYAADPYGYQPAYGVYQDTSYNL